MFAGLFTGPQWSGRSLPRVHCYCFARAVETESDVLARCEEHLGCPMPGDTTVYSVRDVAPNKQMMCVSFGLPDGVARGGSPAPAHVDKKLKV